MVLALLELGDRRDDMGAVLGHRVGMCLRVVVLVGGARRLGDERPQAHVVGFVGELRELFVDDAQLFAQPSQADARLLQSTFDQPRCPRRAV